MSVINENRLKEDLIELKNRNIEYLNDSESQLYNSTSLTEEDKMYYKGKINVYKGAILDIKQLINEYW